MNLDQEAGGDTTPGTGMSGRRTSIGDLRPLLIVGVAVAVAYLLAARLGFQASFVAEQVTTVWAPTGIAQAALLLWGRRLWPAVWLGAFAANAATDAPLWTAALIATGNTLEALVAAWFLRPPAFDLRLGRLFDAGRFIVLAGMVATTISATIGVATLCLSNAQPWTRFSELWFAWWLGDALGALVVAPVILATVGAARERSLKNWPGVALLVLGSVIITEVVFGELLGATFSRDPLHYVVFPFVIVAAVRFGQPATALVVFCASAVTIWHTVRGGGPFAAPDAYRSLILLQAYMGVLASTGLLLAAAMTERQTSQRRPRAAHAVGEVLADAPDLAHAAPAILRIICENFDWQVGALWVVAEDMQHLRCFSVCSEPDTAVADFIKATEEARFRQGTGLPGRVWATGAPLSIQDVRRDPNFPRAPVARAAGIHGAFAFPICLDGDVLGVVEFFTFRAAAPDPELLDAMSTVGNQVGQFIGRKRVEAAVLDEQRRMRSILETALDAVIGMDDHGVITEFNPAAERLFGYHKDVAVGQVLADLLIPPDMRQQHRDGLARYLASGEGPLLNRRIETRGCHADGHEFPIELAVTRVTVEGPARFTGFVRDLTMRAQAEEAVRINEERFRSLAASTSALTLYEQDQDLRYRWVFPQHPEFPHHNIGKTDDELLPAGEGERLSRLKRTVLETGVGRREEITVTLPTEIRSYDLMVEPRRDSRGAIVGISGVAVDITERKRANEALRVSEDRLREADRRKDEFLAMLAHELRNPLAPIRTGLQLVRLAGDTPESVERIRSMMERQIGHMVRLIDDLLDVSRITSGKIHLQKAPVSLADVVKGAVEANRPAIDAAQLDLAIRLPDAQPVLFVDPTRFVQVISNLLHNAAKFTDAGGRVVISAEIVSDGLAGHELVLSVSDTGIGISSEMLPRVFELFTQGERSTQRPQSGLGIGLALARRIVEMHGGRIEARSAGPGCGSEFTIYMPVIEAVGEVPDHLPVSAAPRQVKRRVLVVDDNADAADTLAELVRALGGEATTAADGMSGIERVSDFAPDIILLDIGMPAMDGYETCRRIRQQPFGKGAFIVALTGWGQDGDKRRAAEAGFDAHLTKPADPGVIERLLAEATSRDEGTPQSSVS